MKCTLVLSLAVDVDHLEGDLIGVDRGAYLLAKNDKPMVMAIGDFDSVTEEELTFINEYTRQVIKLDPVKNDTDTLAAIKYAVESGYDEIELYGGLGKRLDHTLANIFLLLSRYEVKSMKDENTSVRVLEEGRHEFFKKYRYVSFFAFNEALITLEGFKYCVTDYNLKNYDTIGISNEIEDSVAVIEVKNGQVLAIEVNE